MAALWNLQCEACDEIFMHQTCSMYDIPACPKCGGERTLAPTGLSTRTPIFPFTVNHVDGKPMVIESMQHLRRVERTYGVAFSAFNKDNINDLDPLKDVPVYKGDDPGFRRR